MLFYANLSVSDQESVQAPGVQQRGGRGQDSFILQADRLGQDGGQGGPASHHPQSGNDNMLFISRQYLVSNVIT